ncbi:MAG: hypothetical protein HY940_03995 [Gammaproteobacteria bacterium]|nr:hypothetical protein [Gammaproteobacteria bacterium]
MTDGLRWTVIVLMCALLIGYGFLNRGKMAALLENYAATTAGRSALDVRISSAAGLNKHIRLPESDVFDMRGSRRVSFLTLADAEYQQLAQQGDISVNGKKAAFKLGVDGSFYVAEYLDRLVVVTREGDTKTLAALLWKNRIATRDIIHCMDEKLCSNLKVIASWGRLEGPYADSDIVQERRALPRGRWGVAPQTILRIQSKVSTQLLIQTEMLSLAPDNKVTYQGSLLDGRHIAMRQKTLMMGGKILFPLADQFKVAVKPGNNDIIIRYSKADAIDQRAVYYLALTVRPAVN